MRTSPRNRKVLLGVTGSIAAFKAVELIRILRDQEASVRVVMTDASCHFVTPFSLETASGNKVLKGLFEDSMAHIDLARWADVMVVAPATANTIAKHASGVADDLLSTLLVAFNGPVLVAPAMNWRMYENPTVRRNLEYLSSLGVIEVPPEEGSLACGEEGKGRMAAPELIAEAIKKACREPDLSGRKIVVTAGPTHEFLDSVRFISNPSTGKMGFAVARAALRRGAQVSVITGPTGLEPPAGANVTRVVNAVEMREAVLKGIKSADVLVMAAAVSDFSPENTAEGKTPKAEVDTIPLKPSPDILAEVGGLEDRPLLVGFSAEAGGGIERAREKLGAKGADIIVYNDVTEDGSGFGTDTNRVAIIDGGETVEHPVMSKDEVADLILDRVSGRIA